MSRLQGLIGRAECSATYVNGQAWPNEMRMNYTSTAAKLQLRPTTNGWRAQTCSVINLGGEDIWQSEPKGSSPWNVDDGGGTGPQARFQGLSQGCRLRQRTSLHQYDGTQEDCRDMREGVGTRHGSANADYENGCALRKGRSVDNPIDEAGREGEAKARKGPEGRGWG
ncbi:hypothetical protein MMC24_000246 [Lignoscripta atroalba]|nr:hypothetical protein [Lignoscripta atroalba]